jgi:uncharacterized protein YjbI with pentapeptide repeats
MANPEHLAILKQGVDVWNKWRKNNLYMIPDLTSANLTSANLSRADLSNANLSYADLRKSGLYKADLEGGNLNGADLSGANLARSHLKNADLSGANLSGTNLSYANLSGANLSGTNLSYANLSYANLSGANLKNANLKNANLKNTNLKNTNFEGADLSDANLEGANLEGSIGANLESANIIGTILDKIKSEKISLNSTDSTISSFERSLQSQMETMRSDLEEKIEQVKNPFSDDTIKKEIETIISKKIDTIISQDIVQKVGDDVRKLATDFSIKQETSEIIKNAYNKSSSRYGSYADKSEKEALLYRYFGIGFCIAGVFVPIVVLVFILYGQYPNYKHWGRIFMGFPVTITLEAIGLLLLTLSQKATERMRAFSVENCNLDLQSAGYLSAIQTGDMKKIAPLMEILAKSERHYILKKDERTIEESHNKSHLEFMKNVTDALKPIINQKQ